MADDKKKQEEEEPLPWWIWVMVGVWLASLLLFAIDFVFPLGLEWPHYIKALAGTSVTHVNPDVLNEGASGSGDL